MANATKQNWTRPKGQSAHIKKEVTNWHNTEINTTEAKRIITNTDWSVFYKLFKEFFLRIRDLKNAFFSSTIY